jgi:hypothetical protein
MNKTIVALLRISLGFIFLWAFADKTFGLGFATTSANAWINGGSPTYGFLTFATKGPFADFFKSLAGNNFVDIVFMACSTLDFTSDSTPLKYMSAMPMRSLRPLWAWAR